MSSEPAFNSGEVMGQSNQLRKIIDRERKAFAPIRSDRFLMHIQIGLAHLAGYDNRLGTDPLRHIIELPHQTRNDIPARKHLTGTTTVGFVWPWNCRGTQILNDAIQRLGILKPTPVRTDNPHREQCGSPCRSPKASTPCATPTEPSYS